VHFGHELIGRHRFAEDAENVEVPEVCRRAGDDENGNLTRQRRRGKLLLNRDAVDGWQTDIEDHDVGRSLFDEPQRLQAVARLFDDESIEAQRASEHTAQLNIVLDKKDKRLPLI
jgi:hypothetical protein